MLLKKTIPIILMFFLALSISANAAWLESLYGQTVISGAPTAEDQYSVASFSGLVDPSETRTIKHNLETDLNGVIVKSSYDTLTKTAKIELSKNMQLRDYQRVRFDDGIWTARAESDKLTFYRGNPNKKIASEASSMITGAAVVDNNLRLVLGVGNANYIEFPYGKVVPLQNNFIAIAKNTDDIVTVTFSKTLIVKGKEKISGTNIAVEADSENIKLSTAAVQDIPAAKKTSLKNQIFSYFIKVFRKD